MVKITRKTKKELEQTVQAHAEIDGISSREVRQEIKGFMKGASSMLLVDALCGDELGFVKDSPALQALKELSLNRWGQASKNFHSKKSPKKEKNND